MANVPKEKQAHKKRWPKPDLKEGKNTTDRGTFISARWGMNY